MKNFKFRIYTKRNDIKNNMCLVKSFNNDEIICEHEYNFKFSEVELMQYTGLKDKNEREIYEGDIIKAKIGVVDFILKIEFESGKFMAVDDDDLTAFDLFTITDKCEVIGNIFENLELLK